MENIELTQTINSGGDVMLDVLLLKNGKVLVVGDEVAALYKNMSDFENSADPISSIELF